MGDAAKAAEFRRSADTLDEQLESLNSKAFETKIFKP